MLTVKSTINLAGQAVPNIIPAVQGDTGRSIEFTLADFTIPAGATANYYIQKPSGEAVYNAAEIVDNIVIVNLTAQALAEPYDNYGQVRIFSGDEVITSFDFILLVKPFRGIGAIESTTEMNIFDKAVQNAMANIDGMLPNIIAPVFDTSTAYTAGDYVIYSGKLYQFTTDHAAGAWTGSDAKATTVSKDTSQLKEDLSNLEDGILDVFSFSVPQGEKYTSHAIKAGRWYIVEVVDSATVTLVGVDGHAETLFTNAKQGQQYIHPTYDNATIYTNATASTDINLIDIGALPYQMTQKVADTDISHSVVFSVPVGNSYPIYGLQKNHIYLVKASGTNFSANIRPSNGTAYGSPWLSVENGNSYIKEYTDDDCKNIYIYAANAGTVEITDLNAVTAGEKRYYFDVKNVRELVEAIDYSHTHKVTINLLPGVYDLITGLGSSYFNNAPSENFGLVLGNDVIINGNPRALITANYTGSVANVMKYFSVFNAGMCVSPYSINGSFTLNGVNIQAKNIRYIIHDDNNQTEVPYHNKYKDCNMYLDNSGNTAWNNHQIIGGGLGANGIVDIENCIFDSTTHSSRTSIVGYHNSSNPYAKSFINFTGNLLRPVNSILYLGTNGTSTSKTIANLSNNKWGGVYSFDNSSGASNIEVNEWNNVVLS